MSGETLDESTISEGLRFDKQLNDSLRIFFGDMLKAAITNPLTAKFYIQTLRWQRKAATKRNQLEKEGLHVPPILILSITNRCNLSCRGCFNSALRDLTTAELPAEKLRDVIREAKELGISFIVISGGEPLVRPEIITIAEENPSLLFVMFTNGTLLDNEILNRIRKARNLVPLISLEGHRAETDERRGAGVYERLTRTMAHMKHENIFFGTSVTVTSSNFFDITDRTFVADLFDKGCRLFLFEEYTPVQKGTEPLVVTPEQRLKMVKIKEDLRSSFRAVFLNLPADEEDVGGCLAAGRGFIHINALGDVEPCPFVPYSDTNLKDKSLRESLASDLLLEIRRQHSQLPETSGGCTLWNKRDWLRTMSIKKDS